MKRQTKLKTLVRCLAFLVLTAVVLLATRKVFGIDHEGAFHTHQSLTRERRGSLDGVFIGASNVLYFWQPAIAWSSHGIAVLNYAYSSLAMGAVKYMVIEARKTQPDALYIINLNTFKAKTPACDITDIHRTVDYMPMSMNRIQLIDAVAKQSGLGLDERLQLLFPIIQFHSRWDNLKPWVYGVPSADYKTSMVRSDFLQNCQDMSGEYVVYGKEETIPEETVAVVEDLLDYLDRNKVNALFVKVPQVTSQKVQSRMNHVERMVTERGYVCLDLLEGIENVGLNKNVDFMNRYHTNVHGCTKIVEYLADYLVENYGFTDKRGLPGWESWDAASAKYLSKLASCLLPFEMARAQRFESAVPALDEATSTQRQIAISWSAVDAVDGYEVFRKPGNGAWERCGVTDTSTLCYVDEGLEPSTKYTYTVAPFRSENGVTLYGSFDTAGVSARTEKADAGDAGGNEA